MYLRLKNFRGKKIVAHLTQSCECFNTYKTKIFKIYVQSEIFDVEILPNSKLIVLNNGCLPQPHFPLKSSKSNALQKKENF